MLGSRHSAIRLAGEEELVQRYAQALGAAYASSQKAPQTRSELRDEILPLRTIEFVPLAEPAQKVEKRSQLLEGVSLEWADQEPKLEQLPLPVQKRVEQLVRLRKSRQAYPAEDEGYVEGSVSLKRGTQTLQSDALLQPLSFLLEEILKNQGVRRLKTVGEMFDPHLHEAVGFVSEKGKENEIVDEAAPGYMIHDRLLQAAKVRIRVAPGSEETRLEEEKQEEIT